MKVKFQERNAQMAELVDALDSKSGYRKVVQVRFLFWALDKRLIINRLSGVFYSLKFSDLPFLFVFNHLFPFFLTHKPALTWHIIWHTKKKMKVIVTPRLSRDHSKIFYSFEWGKKAGQRIATGVFTYVHPANTIQKKYNNEAHRLLEAKKSRLILDALSVGSDFTPSYRFERNFLDYYKNYVEYNKTLGNRHLECSYSQFRQFFRSNYLAPKEVTEELCNKFQKYLLSHLNGETPSNYFAKFKKVLKAATKEGYFKISPSQYLPVKANKNVIRKNSLEVEEYIQLLHMPALNKEVRDAFIFCCYTGLRWCDVKALRWNCVKRDSIVISIVQRKTNVEHVITLHPIIKEILNRRMECLDSIGEHCLVFNLPTANGANKVLSAWCKSAAIEKHITWNCARLSFSETVK